MISAQLCNKYSKFVLWQKYQLSSGTTTSTALFFDFIKYFGPKMYNLKIYDKECLIQLFIARKMALYFLYINIF